MDMSDQRIVLHDIAWDLYSTLLETRGDRPRPKMVYLDGDLSLMTTGFPHEHLSERLGYFVMEVVVGLSLPCIAAGQTTFRREQARGGVEGDKTFYLANVEQILALGGKKNIDLQSDPPPDLAIEAVDTHGADAATEVWRRLGVPEVWVCDAESMQILALQPDGRYAEQAASVAFPFLTAAEIHDWVTRPLDESDTPWMRELRRWVAGPLAERVKSTGRGERPEA